MRKNKLNIKISKKHIIIACLTLFLAIAVYSNYWISQNSGLKPTDVIEGVNLDDDYGEVLYVNGTEYLTALSPKKETILPQKPILGINSAKVNAFEYSSKAFPMDFNLSSSFCLNSLDNLAKN